MSRILNTSKFYDAFTGISGGGVTYLPENVAGRIQRVTNVEFYWDLKNASVLFDSATQTIIMQNQYDSRTFAGQEFQTGDTIVITDTSSNDGTFTITEISEDGKTATVAESLTDESADNASFFGITPITSIDFYFNLIPNGTSIEDYTSIVDPFSKQKFTVDGLDANDSTAKPMAIATKSFAWVTEKITDVPNNKTNAVYVKGQGFDDYIQKFKITQFFTVTPFSLNSQFDNFSNRIPPPYYFNGKSLKYICRADAKFLSGNPVADHSAVDLGINGTGSWYNEAALGSVGEYSIVGVEYYNNDTDEPLEKLDIAFDCRVVITVVSKNARFVDFSGLSRSTMFILGFNTCPSAESDYQNTPTTQRDNFFQDRCTNSIGEANENGLQFGTVRQSITACNGTFDSESRFMVNYIFSAGLLLKSYWQAKEDGDRYYAISLITQDVLITTTKATDRMTLLCDFQSAGWNRKDESLFSFTGTGIEGFIYPDISNQPRGSLEMFQGDAAHAKIGFKILQSPDNDNSCAVNNITWQVVGEKTGKENFIFESKIIDFSTAKKLLQVQQLDYSDVRGFVSYPGDPTNEVAVIRDEANDTETESAFIASYGLIAKFEQWANALNQFQFSSGDLVNADIAKDISDITQDWSSYDNVEGWNLYLKFSCSITSILGAVNIFETQIPIKVKADDQVIWAGASGEQTQVTQYFIKDGSEEISSINRDDDKITLIRTTLVGSFPLGENESYFGLMTSTNNEGSIFDRRIASSEIPSESDSPWSPTAEDTDADFSWSNGNLRFNVYDDRLVVEGYFDCSIYYDPLKAIAQQSGIIIQGRIGAYKISTSS